MYSWCTVSFEQWNARHERRQRRWRDVLSAAAVASGVAATACEYTKYSIYSNAAARGIRDTPIGAPPGFQNGRRPARPGREAAAVSGST